MVTIENIKVYDLKESVIACRNAKRLTPPDYTDEEFENSLDRAIKLCNFPSNSGQVNFLSGIRVSFDLVYPQYFSPQLQRYHWIDIVTSSSKMHTLEKLVEIRPYNKYVDKETVDHMQKLLDEYNTDPSYDKFMKLLSNCPLGLELFMRVSTNYLQLKNIYLQRKDKDRIKEDWKAFTDFIESLPYFEEFIKPKDFRTVEPH